MYMACWKTLADVNIDIWGSGRFWLTSSILKTVPSDQLLFTPRDKSVQCATQAITRLLASCHSVMPPDPGIKKGHQTLWRPSHFAPPCSASDENKPCKYNEASILWLLVGSWLRLVSSKWAETVKNKKVMKAHVWSPPLPPPCCCYGGQSHPFGWLWLAWHLAAEGRGLLGELRRGKPDPRSAD